jgi:hypothetical protein
MLDDFDDLDSAAFLEDLEDELTAPAAAATAASPRRSPRRRDRRILGMNAIQRFVISLMLFSSVCLLGFFFLLITEKIYPPFLF